MNQKGISKLFLVIIVVVVLVVAVVGVAAYWAMSSGGGDEGGGNGTADGGGDGDGTTVDVAGASSLQFDVKVTPAGEESEEYTYMIKNAGTANLMMRIEMESSSGDNWIYIINGAQQEAWVYSDDEWVDFSDMFSTYWDTWNSVWEGYRTNLLDWTGVGDWSYTTPQGDSVRIYGITVNPTLADSLFQPS